MKESSRNKNFNMGRILNRSKFWNIRIMIIFEKKIIKRRWIKVNEK
jgi:hypothetical protein